jgi:lipopolysaccharide export system protein LptA
MKAAGSVQSELQPPKKTADNPGARLPSMLKQDEPVNVTAKALDYDGTSSRAVYTGAAQLWQQDTSVKGDSITIDDKSGDLSASGSVATTSMLEQTNKDNKKERVRSVATSAEFLYEEALRRATYTGNAHMTGPQGEMTAEKIELYLKESGDEIERAEAYDAQNKLSLREQERTTTGSHLTYTSADDQYVVTGTPVKIVDNCRRETTGRTLIFHRATDSIVVDGNGFRTQTRGGGSCR